jgi:ribosomal protein S18 acetylase RimI-like enzyme
LEVYSHEDAAVEPFMSRMPEVAEQVEALKLPYWLFVERLKPVGILIIGEEPIQLLASPGTTMAFADLLEVESASDVVEAFVGEALGLIAKQNVEYALAKLPFEQHAAIQAFQRRDFKEFDDCHHMICELDETFTPSAELEFKQIRKEEMREFISLTQKFLQGSPDVALTMALKHILDLPEEFLDHYFTMEEFYTAWKEEQPVGILNINPAKGLVSNVGVDPQQRGRGYGRQIMLFALQQLKKKGGSKAYLRVHVANTPAVWLYESLGFVKAQRYKRLIWRKSNK